MVIGGRIKRKFLKSRLFAIFVIIILLLVVTSLFIYFGYIKQDTIDVDAIVEKPFIPITTLLTKTYEEIQSEGLLEDLDIVDDQISPISPQAIFFEVKRIRHRGLYDKIMSPGIAWRQNPRYYYTLTIDGFTHISKDIYSPTGYDEILFTTWDTIFQETRRVQSPSYGQETSTIVLTIIEQEKTGLFNRKVQETTKEEIHLTYCYRTGRWTGDNFYGHPDGYGHYLGNNYEIWFDISQTAYAKDAIPYWVKVNILGLDPFIDYSEVDIDNDNIPIPWEWKWGYDPFTFDDHSYLDPDIDGLFNVQEYQMKDYFADPFSPDIYIEVDGMKKGGLFDWDHIVYDESIQIISEHFAQHGINVHIDTGWPGTPKNAGGELLDNIPTIDQDSGIQIQFYKHHFPDERKGIFRYLIICDGGGHAYPSEQNRIDTMIVGTNRFRVLLNRKAVTPRTQRLTTTSLMIHELGHTMGISLWTFGGVDNYTIYEGGLRGHMQYAEIWGDYESSMNYLYASDAKIVGYSDGSNGAPYDQNDWEHMYLPIFKLEGNAVEDPTLYFDENFEELEGMEVMRRANEIPVKINISPTHNDDWIFNKNLTNQYKDQLQRLVFVENVDFDLRVYVCMNYTNEMNFRNVRIYAKPDVGPTHYSEWSLITEGMLDEETLTIENSLWYQ